MSTPSEPLLYTFSKQLRPAVVRDFWRKKQRTGLEVYYLCSAHTGIMEGPYLLRPDADYRKFVNYLQNNMVWVEAESPEFIAAFGEDY